MDMITCQDPPFLPPLKEAIPSLTVALNLIIKQVQLQPAAKDSSFQAEHGYRHGTGIDDDTLLP
jgi:hypothetical protein